MMQQKILITGASGFIGSHLTKTLVNSDYVVHAFQGEITHKIELSLRPDIVVHLAAISTNSPDPESTEHLYKVNVQGTKNILEFCASTKSKLIFISTIGVYGSPKYLPLDEQHPTNPTSAYAKSKLEGERLCRSHAEKNEVDCLILRLANVYGEGDQNSERLVPSILTGLINHERIVLTSPLPKRDFIFVEDVVKAIIASLNYFKNKTNSGNNGEIVNIGSGKSVSIGELIENFEKQAGYTFNIEYKGLRKEEIMDIYTNVSKAWNILQWAPKTDVITGIKQVISSLKSESAETSKN